MPDLKPQAQRRGVKQILRNRHITQKLTMLYTRQYTIYSLTLTWIYIHNALIATAQEMTIAQHKFLRLGAQKRLKERVSFLMGRVNNIPTMQFLAGFTEICNQDLIHYR